MNAVEVFVDAVEEEAHELAGVVLLVPREHGGVLGDHFLQHRGDYHGILSRPRLII